MLDREQLETFATIVEHGGFERAATALSVTRGAISQRIKALEESLSTVLLLRDKPVRPTPRGEILMRHVKALRLLETSLLHEVAPRGGAGATVSVAIAVNADSLAGWFGPVIRALLKSQPVALEVISDDQDHTFGRLARGEVIGCISTEAHAIQGFVAEGLGAMEYRCVAAPGVARTAFANGFGLQAVLNTPAVLFDRKDRLHDAFLKSLFGFAVDRYTRHYIPSPAALLETIVGGCGYGLVPIEQARPFLAAGTLVELAPQRPVLVELYWHHWQSQLPLAEEITRGVLEGAARTLVRRP